MAKPTTRRVAAAEEPEPSPNGHASEEVQTAITLRRLVSIEVEIPILGTTPLIMQRWSEKAKAMMLASQQSKTRTKKEPKDPDADYEAAFYRLEDGTPGMPATAFKASIGSAARYFDGVTMVMLKTAISVRGAGRDQLVPIVGDPRMREDTPRLATGVADLRYRPEFWPWSCTLLVSYLPSMLDKDSVWNLVDASGRGGIGSWRPSSPKSMSGTFGQYSVDFDKMDKAS